MISKAVKGKRVVVLQAPDVRKLNDTSFVLKQIAAGIDDVAEQEYLQGLAKACVDVQAKYAPPVKAETPAPKK